jgi:L-iditol 2-dehydrogenase
MCQSCPSNPSVQVTLDHRIEIKQSSIPELKPGQVLIHPRATGICGSDLHLWRHGKIGTLELHGNCVLGHESAGDVLAVGEGVTDIKSGDRVAIEPGVPCGKCFLCWQGDYNLCEDVQFIGVYPYPGAMQRYIVHDARFVFKLPDNMSYAEGALVEPVSVAYHGVRRADLQLGKGVAVAGAGPIGLVTLLLAKASGCTPIVITDLSEERLSFAKTIVPDVITYKIDTTKSSRENGLAIKDMFGSSEYEAPPRVLECTGVESSINAMAYVVRRSGLLLVIGVGRDYISNFPFMHLSLAEIDVKFINRYHDTWPVVINLISNGVIDVKRLVTHRFELEDGDSALAVASDPKNGSIKVLVEDNKVPSKL